MAAGIKRGRGEGGRRLTWRGLAAGTAAREEERRSRAEAVVVGLELGSGFWDPAEGVLRDKGLELQQPPPHGELGCLRYACKALFGRSGRRLLSSSVRRWPLGSVPTSNSEDGGVSN